MTFFGGEPTRVPGATGRVKAWALEALGEQDATVLVTELRCHEPGCPPLETVIAWVDAPGGARQRKVHRAAAELTQEEVALLVAAMASTTTMEGGAHEHDGG